MCNNNNNHNNNNNNNNNNNKNNNSNDNYNNGVYFKKEIISTELSYMSPSITTTTQTNEHIQQYKRVRTWYVHAYVKKQSEL